MPPRFKKSKKKNALPQLTFVESPTPSTIKFPNSGSSQSTQPLEVPTVPYAEGGKWLALQFALSDQKNVILPNRRRRKSKSESGGIGQPHRKCAVVPGCELWHQSSRKRSSTTSYAPLEVTIATKPTDKKLHSRHGRKRNTDNVSSNSSSRLSADNVKAVTSNLPNGNSTSHNSSKMDDVMPVAFSVSTPIFESGNVSTVNFDETLQPRKQSLLENLEVSFPSDLRMDHTIDNHCTSPRCKGKHAQGLFKICEGEDCGLQEPEELAPDTPEHESDFTFYQRRLKRSLILVKKPVGKLPP